jgi:D-3-phosphoglycerate dehydrogenase
MLNVLITTVPFADKNTFPLELLNGVGANFVINPIGRKLKEEELADLIGNFDILIAGTEPITANVLSRASKLKLISRVGIGLDNVDLLEAQKRGILVSYTPDAPAPAVAELTIGLMLSLLRNIHLANKQMHEGEWNRYFGRRIPEITLGVIGAGRIGGRVMRRLVGFGTPRILVNDLNPNQKVAENLKLEWVDKETIYKESDLITLHLPLTHQTKDLITERELMLMKKDSMIINTSRGGIINESDLFKVLSKGHLSGAAIDVFEQEPYLGDLARIERCILTSHMGSMSIDCRIKMEIEATEEVVRFITKTPLKGLVPSSEYQFRTI